MGTKEPLRDRWIRQVIAHHRLILLVGTLLAVVCGWLSTHLRVDTDLRRLLPDGHPVLVGLESIERTFGSTGSVNVVIKDGTPAARHAFVQTLAQELEGHPMLRDVDERLPSDFFTRHALYYLSDAEMEELDTRVQDYTHYEFCSRAAETCLLPPDAGAPEALEAFIERKRGEALARTGFRELYEREGIDATVVLLHPTEPASSLDFARRVSDAMRSEIREIFERPDQPWSGTGMQYNIVGPYTNKSDEQRIIRADMVRGGIIGLVGVVAIIYLLFRSMRAVLVLLVPLAFGVIWSLGVTQLVLGRLNLMTSLISTVLMGMGIDAGIHFYSRAKIDRRRHDDAEAIRRAFHSLIIPLFVASGTTVGAFLVMSTSEFPAFREFGLISAWGVALCMLAMCTVLPALLYAVGIKRHEEPLPHREGAIMRKILGHPGALFAIIVVVTVLTFQGVRRVGFEYNGRALQSDQTRRESEEDIKLISKVFGKDIHAGILVRDDLESTRATLTQARQRHELRKAAGDTTVASLFAAPDLLPPADIDMAKRKAAIDAMYEDNEDTFARLEDIAEGREPSAPKAPSKPGTTKPGTVGDDWDDFEDEEGGGGSDELEPPTAVPDDPPAKPDAKADAKPDAKADAKADAKPDAKADAKPDAKAEAPTAVDAAQPAPVRPASPPAPEPKRMSREEARQLVDMFRAQPFGIDELPDVLLRKVRTRDGAYGIFAYPNFDAADMRKGVEFTEETSSYLDGQGLFVGETTVYASMFLMLREEAPIVVGMASVLIAAFVYWQLRSFGLTMLTLLPLGLALWWVAGLMGALDLRFTLFNLPILPAILGIGVDNGVYLTDTIRRTHGELDGLSRALQETGGAILAATFTTVAGFAAFMVADSAGLRGIGQVASIGISLAAVSALLVLPTLWALGQRRRRRRG
ncbi:MAG: MMPL family transporter [Nannocystaceae bacterium]|nr:MMPL family transporter [Nannocystaceae bacterium]